MSNKIYLLLCKLGIHIEKFLTIDICGGSSCACGKKKTSAITWPNIPSPLKDNKGNKHE